MKGKTLLILLLLAGCGGAGNDDGRPAPGAHREEVMADLGLSEPVDQEYAAMVAREWVYKANNPLPEELSSIPEDEYSAYSALKSGERKYWCAGMAYVLSWMLEEIGIPARKVSLASESFFDGTDTFATHQTTEAYINGGWVVHDPSFNVTLQCDGVSSSVAELRACLNPITWTYGSTVDPERTLEAYPVYFSDLLYGYHYYTSKLRAETIADYPFTGWYQ